MPAPLLDRERMGGRLESASQGYLARPTGFYANYGKRTLDLVSAAAGLIVLSPLLAVTACSIKLTSPGPVLFRQVRIGKDGRPFRIVKFRSMIDSSRSNATVTVAGDPRVTAIGAVLRRYKVDELPQLWNVIRGEMSLVGPRPELPVYVANYTAEQRAVLSARPGITDPASIAYRREEQILATQDDPETFYLRQILPDKLARNSAYLEKITLSNDLCVILKTILPSLFPLEKQEPGDHLG
jgi:lipopolysaccharide/colanic/teichoic acid biosynthesis glycosyltransferase